MAQTASIDDIMNLLYNVGGGIDAANINLQEQQLSQLMESFRREFGMGLLDRLLEIEQNPFSIVNAVRLAGQAGGGPEGIAGGFAATGGLGTPSPFSGLLDRLLEDLGGFAGGNPINPQTGMPLTPDEMAFLRRFEGLSLEEQASQIQYLGGDAWEFLRDWAERQQAGATQIVPPDPTEPTPSGDRIPLIGGQKVVIGGGGGDLRGRGPPPGPPGPPFDLAGGGLPTPGLPNFTFGRPRAVANSARRGANSGILRGLR